MRTYDICKENGELMAFEVNNLLLTRLGAIRVVRRISGVKILATPWVRQDVFCRFALEGREFLIEEPWGDNSRYWVGPSEPVEPTSQIKVVKTAFQAAGLFGFSLASG